MTALTAQRPAPAGPVAALTTGSALLCEALQDHGLTTIFGYPGGAALPLYRELADWPGLRHVLVRHEENAALAADGFARASGRPGVCLATSGPGATNLLTGIANAFMDSVPVLALTGQVATAAIGSQAFQEVDIVAMASPITKAALQARTPAEIPELVARAIEIMLSGRPGPVLLDLPKDVLMGTAELTKGRRDGESERQRDSGSGGANPSVPPSLRPSVHSALHPDLDRLAALLDQAERPVLLAGRGVLIAGASESLRLLAELTSLPTITTLLGLGAMPESHPLAFGMAGMHGTVAANMALHHADLVVGLGARFDDRVVGRASDFSPDATLVHVDVDPTAFGRVVRCDVPILADVAEVIDGLITRVASRRREYWLAQLRAWQTEHAACLELGTHELTSPGVVRALRRETKGVATVVADVGQHQMFAALHSGFERPGSFFTSGGLGTMGYGLPAAMGVKLARPEDEVWAIVGDGGFQMSAPELNTLAVNHIPVKIAVLNNACLGMVRQWQELFYDHVYSHSILPQPDFARLAEAHGVPARMVERQDDVAEAIRWARSLPGPVVLDFRVPLEETVLPMVPAGAATGELVCTEGRVLQPGG